MVDTMFGSLIVHARVDQVAELARPPARRSAAKRSAVVGVAPSRPWSASHRGRREVVEGDDRVDAARRAGPRTAAR